MNFSSYSTCRGVFESQWKYALNIFNRNEKYWNLEKFYHKTYLSELDHATTFDMLKIHWIVTIWWFPKQQLYWSHVCDIRNYIILFFYLYNSKYIIFTVNFRETIAPMIISQNAGIDFGWTSSSEILFSCISMNINGFWVREKLSHGRAPRGTFCDRNFSIFNIFHCGWKCSKRIIISFRKRHNSLNNSKNP